MTELLSLNLYELIKANNFVGFSTNLIRRFTMQMLSALQVMKNNRIIHCDLKPEVSDVAFKRRSRLTVLSLVEYLATPSGKERHQGDRLWQQLS